MAILLGALIPTFLIGSLFYLLDKNKEPLIVVLRAFYLGMFSIGLVVLFIWLSPLRIPAKDGQFTSSFEIAFYHAAFIEEFAKFLLFFLGLYFHRAFDERYDGILYGVMIGLGFAFIENILFFLKLVPEMGQSVIWSRSLLSMPLHALVGGMMGYYIGLARFTRYRWKWPFYMAFALFFPILVHGIFDFVLFFYTLNLKGLTIPIVLYMWFNVLKMKRQAQAAR